MDTLALVVGSLALLLNIVFFILLKFTNIMRGPIGYPGVQGATGMDGREGKCRCICGDMTGDDNIRTPKNTHTP